MATIDKIQVQGTTYDINLPATASPTISSLTITGNLTVSGIAGLSVVSSNTSLSLQGGVVTISSLSTNGAFINVTSSLLAMVGNPIIFMPNNRYTISVPNKSGTIALLSDIPGSTGGGTSGSGLTLSQVNSALRDAAHMVDLSVVYKIGNNEEISGVIDFSYIGFLHRNLSRNIADTLMNSRSGIQDTTIINTLVEALDSPQNQLWSDCAINNGFDSGNGGSSRIGVMVGTKGNILLSDGSPAIVTSAYFPTPGKLHITYTDSAGNNHEASLG